MVAFEITAWTPCSLPTLSSRLAVLTASPRAVIRRAAPTAAQGADAAEDDRTGVNAHGNIEGFRHLLAQALIEGIENPAHGLAGRERAERRHRGGCSMPKMAMIPSPMNLST